MAARRAHRDDELVTGRHEVDHRAAFLPTGSGHQREVDSTVSELPFTLAPRSHHSAVRDPEHLHRSLQ